MKYKAVLFDLDGTLLNTLQDLADAVNTGLKRLGFPAHELDEFRYFVGEGREEMARKSLPEETRDPHTIDQLVNHINEYYTQHWSDHTLPYNGIPEMLNKLQTKGIKLTVFSNKPQEFTKANVSGLLANWSFEMVLGASTEVPKKPDATGALMIASQLDINPQDFLYLGDSGIDMLTAVKAGMFPVGALWGFRTAEELLECGAKALIEQPADLLHLVE